MDNWKLNTSSEGKKKEYENLFANHGYTLAITPHDLKEIVADPITVAVHKASQMEEYTLIDDTTLDVEGADVGIHVRWLLDHLSNYIGHRAYWKVFLAYRKAATVRVYQGYVEGTIVTPQGENGFGFDAVFLPEGAFETLAQSKPDAVNARAKAVAALLDDHPVAIKTVITHWSGAWQKE